MTVYFLFAFLFIWLIRREPAGQPGRACGEFREPSYQGSSITPVSSSKILEKSFGGASPHPATPAAFAERISGIILFRCGLRNNPGRLRDKVYDPSTLVHQPFNGRTPTLQGSYTDPSRLVH
jgi:hypothetical protein